MNAGTVLLILAGLTVVAGYLVFVRAVPKKQVTEATDRQVGWVFVSLFLCTAGIILALASVVTYLLPLFHR